MDRRAVAAALRQIERQIGAEEVVIEGTDGQRLRLQPTAALDMFLAVVGGTDPGLPEHVARWIAEHGVEGQHDITGAVVRRYRATHGKEKEETA
jgi:hypothetical protein